MRTDKLARIKLLLMSLFWLVIILFVFFFMVINVFAQEPPPVDTAGITDDQVNAIAKQLYCPVCENIPLDVCPTQACAQWRELIREKLAAGWNEKQIKNYFVEQYGERVLGAPPVKGINWLIYLIPPLAILAGGFILYKALRTWKTSESQSIPTASPASKVETNQTDGQPSDEYVKRLEDELRKRESA
jgi:cytochrome c-type biogenesis protein CcmH